MQYPSLPIYMSVPGKESWSAPRFPAVYYARSSGFARPLRFFPYRADDTPMNDLRKITIVISAILFLLESFLIALNLTAILALLKVFTQTNAALFFYFVVSVLFKLAAGVMGIIAALLSINDGTVCL
eukprot:TRINITY_DN13411_c0_g2_i4.p1 TRINITY_DN13411_c0_g2~~TRINITY_DN13411_c0_g2_i4.p1  ORF type:complete len:127 (+),score=8.68 TRINITY_DN13411_c0_g2_i4:118-498(+)